MERGYDESKLEQEAMLTTSTTEIHRDTAYMAYGKVGHTQLIGLAPATQTERHASKRLPALDDQAAALDQKRLLLADQAVEKDRQFKRKVAHLRTRIAGFREKLADEVFVRDEDWADTKAAFERHLAAVKQHVEEEVDASCAVVAEDWTPPQGRRLDAWGADFDHFVNVTVPETIESQSGRVTRHLIKAQETFEIDNTKLLKREAKIEQRFAAHKVRGATNHAEVARKRAECFASLDNDMRYEEERSQMAEEKHSEHCEGRVEQVRDLQSGLAGIRATNDAHMLNVLEQTMSRLQQTVLDNFGLHANFK